MQWCCSQLDHSHQLSGANGAPVFPALLSVTPYSNSHDGNIYIMEINKRSTSWLSVWGTFFLENWSTSTSLALPFFLRTLASLWVGEESSEGSEWKNDTKWFKRLALTPVWRRKCPNKGSVMTAAAPNLHFLLPWTRWLGLQQPSYTMRKDQENHRDASFNGVKLLNQRQATYLQVSFCVMKIKPICFHVWWSGLLPLAAKDILNWYPWWLKEAIAGPSLFHPSTLHP